PMFTKALAPGLGLAEDPGAGNSFGRARCEIVAQALWECHLKQITDPTGRAEFVRGAFRERGLDPARPYLNRDSADTYYLHLAADCKLWGGEETVGLQEVQS